MLARLNAWYAGGTLVQGHRGACAYAPMNTIPSFLLAVEQGVDFIELDVHRSQDGHAVIVHNFTVDETTDGRGPVTAMTLAQLKTLDAGSWFDAAFCGARIPTLGEVIEAVGDSVRFNIEIKSQSQETDGVEQVVADVIAKHGIQHRAIVSSFNPPTLQRFRAIMPDVPIAFIHHAAESDAVGQMRQLGLTHEFRHPHHSLVDAAYMQWARGEGYRVNAWTVNDPARAIELRDLGVDNITTDTPDVILAALRGA